MPQRGEHAIVLGASMSGMLAARVLADFYAKVTVVERDILPDGAAGRRGVPQGRQGHALLGRGGQLIDELFPGLLAEWAAGGGQSLSYRDLPRIHMSVGGHLLVKAKATHTREPLIHLSSRPFLESKVRQRLRAVPNVTFLEGRDIVDFSTAPSRTRVSGVTIAERAAGGEICWLPGDLVVDATGRGSRTPAFLKSIGYQPPAEQHVVTRTAYSSQMLRMPAGDLEPLIMIGPVLDRPTGLFLSRYEDDQWIFTAIGMLGEEPPADLTGMIRYVRDFAPAHVISALEAAHPLGEVARHRMPSSQWRRYDRLSRFPDGLLVCGDAICSFNPIYGQGMTIGALDALAIRDCLRAGARHLPERYFRTAAKSIGLAWSMAAGSDLVFPDVVGPRPLSTRVTNRYIERVLTACESDVVVAEQFFRVNHFLDHPLRLIAPAVAVRVARTNLRGRRRPVTGEPIHSSRPVALHRG